MLNVFKERDIKERETEKAWTQVGFWLAFFAEIVASGIHTWNLPTFLIVKNIYW